jgi:uncharacterized protein (DUF2267 family)
MSSTDKEHAMQYNDFLGQVQHRARLADQQQALRATRATLETLAERLSANEAHDLAAQLPQEIGRFLERSDDNNGERFGLDEFINRVCTREHVNKPDGTFHARVIIEVLQEAVSPGEIHDVLSQLPQEYNRLFAAGSDGAM